MNDQELANLASEIAKKAYAPYSNFRVGAALITDSGNIYTGGNICLLYTSPSPRDGTSSRMPSSA